TGASASRTDLSINPFAKPKPPALSVSYSNVDSLEVHAGAANDLITAGLDPQQPTPLPGRVTIDGGGGTHNHLSVGYSAADPCSNWEVTATQVNNRNPDGVRQNAIVYRQVQGLELDAGSKADTIEVRTTSVGTTVKGGGGADDITVGGIGGNLDNLQ